MRTYSKLTAVSRSSATVTPRGTLSSNSRSSAAKASGAATTAAGSDLTQIGNLRKLPIWVRSDPAAVVAAPDAFAALERLFELKVPRGVTVALDLETAVSFEYVRMFHRVMRWAGYYVWVYGSASTIFDNPHADGYWVADFAGKGPFMYNHARVRSTQYTSGPN